MSQKIAIRFLRPGSVEMETPDNWDAMMGQEKMDWALERLQEMSDKDIIQAMSDYPAGYHNFLDETPEPAAIEDGDGKLIVTTAAWSTYISEKGLHIIMPVGAGH